MFKTISALAAAILALSAGAAADPTPIVSDAAAPGDAAMGFAYAQQNCASCHAIGAREMRSPNPLARSFDAIANTPGLTRTALNAWLHSSHTNMPNLIVDPQSVDDLSAYLLTLKRPN